MYSTVHTHVKTLSTYGYSTTHTHVQHYTHIDTAHTHVQHRAHMYSIQHQVHSTDTARQAGWQTMETDQLAHAAMNLTGHDALSN